MKVPNNISNTEVVIRQFNEPRRPARQTDSDDHHTFQIETIQILRMNFTATHITLIWDYAQRNRVLNPENANRFLSVCFQGLRFPREEDDERKREPGESDVSDYVYQVLQNGITIGERLFYFFGHSNSQLREKTCLLYSGSKEEIWGMVNRLGDFSQVTSVAKRAKRQGQLFSACRPVFQLPWTGTGRENGYPVVDDIEKDGQNFTDGCGYISTKLMRRVARKLDLRCQNEHFVPSVVQIRYRGFKGILAVNPAIETDVVFRKSMDKFPCIDDSFCVVDTSKPYVYGKLNQEIVAQLSALGISDDTLKTLQQEHYKRLDQMFENPIVAVKFLAGEGKTSLTGELLEEGSTPSVTQALWSIKSRIMKTSVKEKATGESKPKLSIMVEQSRFVFAVHDPDRPRKKDGTRDPQLKENEVYFAPTIDGEPTPITGNVMLVRNPCLSPGDLLLRRAVNNPGCRHLVDCIVFPVRGKRATAFCSGGGDLDGDQFTVVWDPRLVPRFAHEPCEYKPAEVRVTGRIDLDVMTRYFAYYNNASLGRTVNLFWKWATVAGVRSSACKKLNECFAKSVDGERVYIPKWLWERCVPAVVPTKKVPIWEELLEESQRRYNIFLKQTMKDILENGLDALRTVSYETMQDIVQCADINLSNSQVMGKIYDWWYYYQTSRNHDLSDRKLLENLLFEVDCTDFSYEQKRQAHDLGIPGTFLENALTRSDIIPLRELEKLQLDGEKFHWKPYYAYSAQYHTGYDSQCMKNLCEALCEYTRTMIVLQYSDHYSVALYFPRMLTRDDYTRQHKIGAAVCFQFINGQVHKLPLTDNWSVYIGEDRFQLGQGNESKGTFIWLTEQLATQNGRTGRYGKRRVTGEPVEPRAALKVDRDTVIVSSIALKNPRWCPHRLTEKMGLIWKERLMGAEMYVVSNRVPLKLRTLPIANTHIPVRPIPPPEAADYDAPDIDNPRVEHAEMVAQLLRFQGDEHIMLEKKADSFMPLFGILHYYGQSEQPWCYKLVDTVMKLYPTSITPDSEVFQILLYIPRMAEKFMDHLTEITPGVCVKLLCALFRASSVVPLEKLLGKMRTLLERMTSVDDAVFSAEEYCRLLTASVLVLDPVCGTYFVEALSRNTADMGYPYLRKFGRLVCLDLLGESADGLRKRARLMRVTLVDNSKESAEKTENAAKEKTKFIFHVTSAENTKLRVGDVVRFTRINKPKYYSHTDELVCMLGIIIDIFPILVRFDWAPPADIQLAVWRMQVVANRTTFKCALNALCTLVTERSAASEAYGQIMGNEVEELVEEERSEQVYKYIEGLNELQKKAVRRAYASCSKLTVVQGPPGTGKTHMIVALLRALVAKYGKCQVLAVASTNNAADNILSTYLKRYPDDHFAPVRIGDKSSVAKELQTYALVNLAEGRSRSERQKRQEKKLQEADLVVSTCTGAGLADLKKLGFSVVVIDEASQLTEPCALIAIVKARRAVLVGDHKQLPPQVHKLAKSDNREEDLSVSLFERMAIAQGNECIMLTEHYRCHPFILQFPSEQFYGGLLKSLVNFEQCLPPAGFNWPHANKPVVLINIDGRESYGRAGSKFNETEANVVISLLERLLCFDGPVTGQAVEAKQVGVISAYKDQVNLLKRTLVNAPKLKNLAKDIDVVTVDGFQGKEKDVIIFSMVRCKDDGKIGFLEDERRFNVLMTRARRGMMVVASVKALKTSNGSIWQRWVEFVEDNGLVVDGQQYVERA